jgi:hypothetical protein
MIQLVIYWILIGIAATGKNSSSAKRKNRSAFIKLFVCVAGSVAGGFVMKLYFGLPSHPSFTEAALSGAGALTGALVFRNGYRIVLPSAASSSPVLDAEAPDIEDIFKHDFTIHRGNEQPDDLKCFYLAVKRYNDAIRGGENTWQAIIRAERAGRNCMKEKK